MFFFTIVSFGNVLKGWPIQIPFASDTLVGYNLFFGIQNVHVLHMNNVWVSTQIFFNNNNPFKIGIVCSVFDQYQSNK
jgi:hypothetical protein